MARPLWTPKKVAIDESTRHISIAARPNKSALPPRQPYPCIPSPPRFSSLIAGSSSNGNESSIQYLLMIGATLVSMNVAHLFQSARRSSAPEGLSELVKVAVRCRQRLWCRALSPACVGFHGCLPGHGDLLVLASGELGLSTQLTHLPGSIRLPITKRGRRTSNPGFSARFDNRLLPLKIGSLPRDIASARQASVKQERCRRLAAAFPGDSQMARPLGIFAAVSYAAGV